MMQTTRIGSNTRSLPEIYYTQCMTEHNPRELRDAARRTAAEPRSDDVTGNHSETGQFAGIQAELLLATGLSQDLKEMLQFFMTAAVKSLGLKAAHVYLLESIHTDSEKTESAAGFHYLLSYPQQEEAAAPHQVHQVEDSFKTIYPCDGQAFKIIEVDEGLFTIYCLPNLGNMVLQFKDRDYQANVAESLKPVMHRLSLACHSCLKIARLHSRINLNKVLEKTYEEQANQDPLTKLPNRRAFRYNLYQEIANSQRYNHYGAILYIDLDHFKNINDSLGHSVGDMLLTRVADKFSHEARVGDDVYRIGGDEFVFILRNVGETEDTAIRTAQSVVKRIIDSMAEPIEVGEYTLHITPSIGVTIFPDKNTEENDSESVLKHADTAMYRAKSEGRNTFAFYDPEMQVTASKRLIIEDYLRKAINNNELRLEYQPIVDTTGQIIAAESLLRWRNPALGDVPPDEFIYIAEESNLMLEVSDWVLNAACAFASKVMPNIDPNSPFKYFTVNISPKQFKQQKFVANLVEVLNKHSVPHKDIRLEFTENILIDNIDETIAKMEELLAADIKFILDDFGTGYSSLSYLHKLPLRTIKIDKSFVTGFKNKSYANKAIVDAIIAMADRMDLHCVIEGVETEEDAAYFISKDIYAMQGYHYHRPLSEKTFLSLMKINAEV